MRGARLPPPDAPVKSFVNPTSAAAGTGVVIRLRARFVGPLRGSARPPGDKSISHRALILGALAHGRTEVEGLLEAEDVICTAGAARLFGAAAAFALAKLFPDETDTPDLLALLLEQPARFVGVLEQFINTVGAR